MVNAHFLQVGRYAEHLATMRFIEAGLEVYSTEVDVGELIISFDTLRGGVWNSRRLRRSETEI